MDGLAAKVGDALVTSFGMFWSVAWSLVLGFVLSGLIQAVVSWPEARKPQRPLADGVPVKRSLR